MEKLPEKVIQSISLDQDEKVLLWLKGAFKEWLVCTDKQVFVIKQGFLTGHVFGSGVFQIPYKNITNVTVNYHLLSGYFELSSGGMQNSEKKYWSTDEKNDPAKAPNCISITGKDLANEFKKACGFIINLVQEQTQINNTRNSNATNDLIENIEKLAALKDAGILTEEEFTIKKNELLAKM